ncbi:hypothetical protein N1851_030903 [Merluccius polli]|uniref:Endonuclease/exonuclease/phosphatase domain-containing protein n=1 Tax=Merluccius polli TaxID=89951 RepID=A0AA47M4W4_MERPO|nr:hypothetical protein N1851_030903 [Merluccius polli]
MDRTRGLEKSGWVRTAQFRSFSLRLAKAESHCEGEQGFSNGGAIWYEVLVLAFGSSVHIKQTQSIADSFFLAIVYRLPGPYSLFVDEFSEFAADLVTYSVTRSARSNKIAYTFGFKQLVQHPTTTSMVVVSCPYDNHQATYSCRRNVQPNPGPFLKNISTLDEFRARSGLGILHLNVRSLLPKIDTIKIWVQTTETDILVLSETWLNKSVSDKDICINGYNVFRCDRPKKGGGVAIYIKNKFHATLLSSISISKQFEFLALKLDFQQGKSVTVMGCYRPPSACSEALSSLNNCVSGLNSGELVGDLNLDWLSSASDGLKSICDSLNLSQLIDSPTRPNIKGHGAG